MVITRIITSKGRIKSLRQAFDEIVAERGLLGFYKGIGAYVSSQQTRTLKMFSDMDMHNSIDLVVRGGC